MANHGIDTELSEEGDLDRPVRVATVLFAAIALGLGVDVVSDWLEAASLSHVLAELAAALVAVAGIVLLGRAAVARLRRERARSSALARDLASARADADRWKAEAGSLVRGLSDAIDAQLVRWELSPAEREIAMLLLKGLSLKEIAGVRGTSERTVRQQTLSIYRKANLAGRAELSAFFLEDLLVRA